MICPEACTCTTSELGYSMLMVATSKKNAMQIKADSSHRCSPKCKGQKMLQDDAANALMPGNSSFCFLSCRSQLDRESTFALAEPKQLK